MCCLAVCPTRFNLRHASIYNTHTEYLLSKKAEEDEGRSFLEVTTNYVYTMGIASWVPFIN